jgi:hypothetical protein
MQTYDEPGRARKQCPSCQKYNHVKSKVCGHCNIPFGVKPLSKPDETPESAPKPKFKQESKPVTKSEIETFTGEKRAGFEYYAPHLDTGNPFRKHVITPAGKCTVKLTDFTPEGIKAWADEVAEVYAAKHEHLSKEAVEYYSKQFYKRGDEATEKLIKSVIWA